MKNFKLLSISILSALLFITSCSTEDLIGIDIQDEDFFLSGKVDGVEFSIRESVLVSMQADQTAAYTIAGAEGDIGFSMMLNGPAAEGAFVTEEGSIVSLSYQESNPLSIWGARRDSGSGTITITENNSDFIQGTFSFTGVNIEDNTERVFTEGKFKAIKL